MSLRAGSVRRVTAIAMLGVLLAGCEGHKSTLGSIGGGLAGGVLGGAAGRSLGGRNAELIGTILGAIVGSMIGGGIGERLDERDRLLAERSVRRALDDVDDENEHDEADEADTDTGERGRLVTWRSRTNPGVRGSAQVVDATPRSGGGQCRQVRQIAYVNGEEIEQTQTYCRGRSGRWELG